eukprot:CAMPEP_0197516488 /NCGR_PEP_ID=MMETSP1318-20131121/1371_1 /TAXON_ID=552666 /ORGANISM="Partenskyella glossopodia, Strain RCC365" /LENGTH=451 /DNA_ID=CAMNT_0043065265 /DNA_START=125 /DNA_END=1480 /DNA_ORIENTATION=-
MGNDNSSTSLNLKKHQSYGSASDENVGLNNYYQKSVETKELKPAIEIEEDCDRQKLLAAAATMSEAEIHDLSKTNYHKLIGRSKDAYDAIYKHRGLPEQGAWLHTFDHFLMWWMLAWLTVLCLLTYMVHPGLFFQPYSQYAGFWFEQVFKPLFMLTVAYIGGTIVEKFNVKVNYTRKVQHFCAYLIPLVMRLFISAKGFQKNLAESVVVEWWGYWWTMLSFAVFIYPIRTRVWVIDRCFSSLDRPEDRPMTIFWITTQIFLGYIIMSCYTTYMTWSNQITARALIFIPVIITGIGDGFAEPVGRSIGGKVFSQGLKYRSAALGSTNLYTRSFEGSFAVWISGVIAIFAMWDIFFSWYHVVAALLLVPGVSTIAEAYSPHTWDTPFLLSTGAGILWAQTFIPEHLGSMGITIVLVGHALLMTLVTWMGWRYLVLERNGIALTQGDKDGLMHV